MVVLMWRDLTFCQFFLSRETKKLMPTKSVLVKLQNGVWKVRTEHDVSEDLVLSHVGVAYSNTQAKNLLQLELDSRADLVELVAKVLSVGDGGGEFSSCKAVQSLSSSTIESVHTLGKTGSQETRNLLDQSLRCEECIVFLCQLLNELLVLVEPEVRLTWFRQE